MLFKIIFFKSGDAYFSLCYYSRVYKNYFELSNKGDYSLLWEPVSIPDMSFSESIYSEIDIEGGSLKQLHQNVLTVKSDFSAQDDTMVNLISGEKVYVVEKPNNEWWFVRKNSITSDQSSCQGWVPSSCLS